jgi:glycosyltransferase involved in cell wall biosynthesis
VSGDALAAWYSGAVCLVLPSRHEGFGLPALEAMACGCPAVVSAVGALPEIAGDAGIVYGRPDDVGALAAVPRRLVESPAERSRLAKTGREAAARAPRERPPAATHAG